MKPLESAVVSLWLVSEAIVFVRTIASVGPRAHMAGYHGEDRLSGPLLIGLLVLAVWLGTQLALRFPWAAMTVGGLAAFWLGLVMALAGIVLRWYAILTLGRFFSMRVQTSPDQEVVESGPYRYVRHPSYTGALMTMLGVLLMSANWLTLACFVIALPGFAYRMYVEEHALVAQLGDAYTAYMRRSKRLVPFLI